MAVLMYKDPLTQTWLPLTSGGQGPAGSPGPPGVDGVPGEPTTLYVQPDQPDVSVHPDGYPLWLDTDEEPATGGFWKAWSGTQAEYDALGVYDSGTLYVIVP